jgi:Na+(H+)/acetate symporter ActP
VFILIFYVLHKRLKAVSIFLLLRKVEQNQKTKIKKQKSKNKNQKTKIKKQKSKNKKMKANDKK